MFDFQKLNVYLKAKEFSLKISPLIKSNQIDRTYRDQLKRASFSIQLNIAEGSSRFTNADRRNFYIISRGSAYECAAILDHFDQLKLIEQVDYKELTSLLVEISKMLYSLISRLGSAKIEY